MIHFLVQNNSSWNFHQKKTASVLWPGFPHGCNSANQTPEGPVPLQVASHCLPQMDQGYKNHSKLSDTPCYSSGTFDPMQSEEEVQLHMLASPQNKRSVFLMKKMILRS